MSAVNTNSQPDALSGAALSAWKNFLRAHARLMRELDDELRERHGFALGDFDVLIQLALAPRGRLRMCDLAEAVVLSPSGLSRRVERLERAGLVKRERGERDARNIEPRLTAAGRRQLARLRKTHWDGVKQRFADQFSTEELQVMEGLLGRLTGGA
jgi:DNA-binding MarR family transcriptional regulator